MQEELGEGLIREMAGILKEEGADLQRVICVSARGQDLYDWLEGYGLIREAQDGAAAAPVEEPGRLLLHPPGDCTAWEKRAEGPIGRAQDARSSLSSV